MSKLSVLSKDELIDEINMLTTELDRQDQHDVLMYLGQIQERINILIERTWDNIEANKSV